MAAMGATVAEQAEEAEEAEEAEKAEATAGTMVVVGKFVARIGLTSTAVRVSANGAWPIPHAREGTHRQHAVR